MAQRRDRRRRSRGGRRDGVFAVGDVRSGSVKRVASAVGEGSVVVSRIWSYLDRLAVPASAV